VLMDAALYDRYGPPEVLYAGKIARPVAGDHRVLIKVQAATINGGELILRAGALPRWLVRGPFPRQTGLDFVGEIVEVGSAVHGFALGDRVWGLLDERRDETGQMLRSLAEYVAVTPTVIAHAPETLTAIEAVTLPVGGLTALLALRRHARLQPGERLLVRGAAGGVGSNAVQVGAALGGQVTGLAGRSSFDFVSSLGAVAVHDYRTTPPETLGRFDVVLDTVGTELPRYRRLLARGGRMVAVRFDTNRTLRSLAQIAASAVHRGGRIRFFRGAPEADLLAELSHMVDQGVLRPVVGQVYPLSRVAEAHQRLEKGGVLGKVVISLPNVSSSELVGP
jgi:NADPH:quinone reductase-like Zn-dependent oxidoreductase